MPFDILTFALAKMIARNTGVDDKRATQLGLMGGMLPLGFAPRVVVTQAIAQREAPKLTPRATVPDVKGLSLNDALAKIRASGLSYEYEFEDKKVEVVEQNLQPGDEVTPGTIVKLKLKITPEQSLQRGDSSATT